MKHKNKDESGFGAVEGLLILVIVVLIGVVGWFVYKNHSKTTSTTTTTTTPTKLTSSVDTSGWSTYTNTCFQYSFKAPSSLKVNLIESPKLGVSCGLSPTDTGSNGVNDWAEVSADIGNSYVESLPKGPFISIGTPLSINNPTAMRFGGLKTASSVTDVLNSIVSSVDKGSSSSIVTINGHKAALVVTSSPDNPPSNFRTVDTPYCPCTSKDVTLDTGASSIIQITSTWLNSDKQAGQTIDAIVGSIKVN